MTEQAYQRVVVAHDRLPLTLQRMAHQLLERHPGLEQVALVGIQPRGVFLGRRMVDVLKRLLPEDSIQYGELDVTFHRDDFRRGHAPLVPNRTSIDFVVEGLTVVLIDDVLYTGRTVRAALDALLAFGRPRSTELMTLIDRKRFRHLPIEADYVGRAIDTLANERVVVKFAEDDGEDVVRIEAR